MNNIGTIIKEERIKKDMNRKTFADASGISYNTIKAIEDGTNGGTFSVIEKLLNTLGFEIILMKKLQ